LIHFQSIPTTPGDRLGHQIWSAGWLHLYIFTSHFYANMENQFFIRLPTFPVVICRQCQYGVWPSSIASHLKGSAHQVKHKEAQQVQEAIQQWDGIQHDSSQLELPLVLDERIPQLPIYPDGLLCWRENPQCGFVARSMETMKQHWRKIHGWSMQSHGGRMNHQQKEQAQIQSQQSFRTVSCQRVFPSRKGSHFIHIRHPGGDIREAAAAEPMASRLVDAMERSYQAQQQRQSAQGIEAGERDEANPWLRRTRWAEYLSLVPAQDLLDCIAPPEEDAARPEEKGARAIWEAMDGVARVSQRIVMQLGHSIRIEAIRTEKGQLRHYPLQAYMDEESIQEHVRPWQQMLMFFARTQVRQTSFWIPDPK
jgi:hypothetical protein